MCMNEYESLNSFASTLVRCSSQYFCGYMSLRFCGPVGGMQYQYRHLCFFPVAITSCFLRERRIHPFKSLHCCATVRLRQRWATTKTLLVESVQKLLRSFLANSNRVWKTFSMLVTWRRKPVLSSKETNMENPTMTSRPWKLAL